MVAQYGPRACFGERALLMEADDWLAVATRAATVRPIVNL
eukprot:COSAG01_NODE_66897_length_268_cov_1.526627_1_plen_39_part_10